MEEENKKSVLEDLLKKTEKKLEEIATVGITTENLDNLGKLIDIHKDIKNEDYWKAKEENYMYREDYGNYGNYGGGRSRDSRGRFMGMNEDTYGRRGRRYRGHDYLDNMNEDYTRYQEGRDMVNRGNYGAKEDTVKSLDYMMESVACFVDMLKEEASPEEMEIIRKYTRKISEM